MRLYPGTPVDYEIALLKSLGYSGSLNDMQFAALRDEGLTGSLSDMIKLFDGSLAPTIPDLFTDNMWSISDAGTGGAATISISTLPDDGGSPITAVQYRIGAGAWTSLAGIEPGNYTIAGFTDGESTSVQIRAVNAIDADPDNASVAKTVTTGPGAVLTLRQQIENLRDGNTPNGRQSVAALNVAAPGNIPPGCTYSNGAFIFSTNDATLQDWEFTGYQVTVTGSNQTITNCYWGPQENHNELYFLEVSAACSGLTFRHNTLDGFNGYGKNDSGKGLSKMINMVRTGAGATATGPQNWLIEYNRFLNVTGDVLNAAGNGIDQWNYYGPPVNYPPGTTTYNAGTTYALGDYVLSAEDELFISLQNSNVGNTPPTSATGETAWWKGLDPHSDAITQVASDGMGCIHRYNLFDWDAARVVQAVGVTQCIRIVRNTGSPDLMGPVDFAYNVISGPYENFYCIATNNIREWSSGTEYDDGMFASSGGVYYESLQNVNENNPPASSPAWWVAVTNINAPGPVRYIGNWLAKGINNAYFSGMEDAVDAWINNRDSVTDALVPGPVLRVQPETTVLAFLAQSEPAYVTNRGSSYREMTPPALRGTADFTLHQRDGSGTGAETSTTKTTLAPGNIAGVNPSMVVIANALDYIFPGSPFALVELMEQGTGRLEWVDDTNTGRIWERSADMIGEAETDFGVDITRVAEFWWAADQADMDDWLNVMSPIYFGQTAAGASYTLGTGGIDHCLWDFQSASPDVKGRGLFKRTTPLDIVRKGPWGETNSAPWVGIDNFVADSRFEDLGGNYGPHAYSWISDGSHPLTDDPDGQYEAAFDFLFPSFLRAKGLDIQEPYFDVSNVQIGPGGAYLDIPAILPNGGVLSTKRQVKGVADPVSPSIYWQEIAGFEILRTGDVDGRFYICRPGAAGIDPKYQGTVVIQNSTTVRIYPVAGQEFDPGDAVTFMYGAGFCRSGGAYVYPTLGTDVAEKLVLDLPIEHVSSLTDPSADHPFCGFGLKTFGGPFTAPGLPAPTTWFTMGAAGPVFRDTGDVPASTTAIEYRFQFRVPSTVASISGTRVFASQQSTGFDVGLSTNGGATSTFIADVENAIGAKVTPSPNTLIPGSARDIWYEVVVEADLVNRVVRRTVNGTPLADLPLTGPTTDATFQTGSSRRISLCGSGTGSLILPQGVQVAYVEAWFTTGGSKTLRKRVAGNAATVNADAWKVPATSNAT